MVPPKVKRNFYRILPFPIFWGVFAIIYSLLEKGILGDATHYPSTGNPYSFVENSKVTYLASILIGLIIGSTEVMFINKLFVKRSFTQKIVFKTLIYLSIAFVFLLAITSISNANEMKRSLFDPIVWQNVWIFVKALAFWSIMLYISMIMFLSLFYSEVSTNLGVGIIANFFQGKYHQPIEEARIFLFADMKSSTAIAEKLGHVRYFELLKTYYHDMSEAILNHGGEIYQYLGDDIIINLKVQKGLHQNHCLQCFFDMKAALQDQAAKYLKTYQVVPSFKAGLHSGKVTTGELGTLKKDITFTGDVLNTTARIQALCNDFGVDILVSGELMDQIQLDPKYDVKDFGEHYLRGKDHQMHLYFISPANTH